MACRIIKRLMECVSAQSYIRGANIHQAMDRIARIIQSMQEQIEEFYHVLENVKDGEQGPAGPQGPVGPKGDKGEPGDTKFYNVIFETYDVDLEAKTLDVSNKNIYEVYQKNSEGYIVRLKVKIAVGDIVVEQIYYLTLCMNESNSIALSFVSTDFQGNDISVVIWRNNQCTFNYIISNNTNITGQISNLNSNINTVNNRITTVYNELHQSIISESEELRTLISNIDRRVTELENK